MQDGSSIQIACEVIFAVCVANSAHAYRQTEKMEGLVWSEIPLDEESPTPGDQTGAESYVDKGATNSRSF